MEANIQNNLITNNLIPNEEFFERNKEETEDGFYDDRGFYTTPNGSFWDENDTYFNRFGFDKHGGRYDDYGVYFPGKNYNFDYNCYEDEIEKKYNGNFNQINENTKNDLIETYEYNNLIVGQIERLNDDDNQENETEENCDMNDEDMERIYNECIDIVNQSKKKLLEETKNEINNIKTISNSEIKNNENANLNHEVNEN
jgi:hypothetical protein